MAVYGEMLHFLTSGPSLQAIVEYSPSKKCLQRVDQLTRKCEVNQLTPQELRELNEFFRIENLLYKLKVRAVSRLDVAAVAH